MCPKDSSKFLDGSTVPLDKGQFMVYLPRLYYLVKEDKENNRRYLWMSDHDIGGHYLESSMLGAFLSTNYNGKAYSRPSDDIGNDWSTVAGFERNQAVGKYFNNMDYDQWRYLIMLHLSEFGTNDIQKTIGKGDTYNNIVGNTLTCGDSIGYYKSKSSDIETHKLYSYGKQNFLGIEGIINMKTLCGGLLQYNDGIYTYKDPTNLYKTKDEIVALGKGNYRVITGIVKASINSTVHIGDFIGGDYFDTFISKEYKDNVSSKNWGRDSQQLELSFSYNDNIFLFGIGYYNNCGLAYAVGKYEFDRVNKEFAVRNGYFGPIKFI
jgi:hypothetical protein